MAWTGSYEDPEKQFKWGQAIFIGVFIVIAFVMVRKLF